MDLYDYMKELLYDNIDVAKWLYQKNKYDLSDLYKIVVYYQWNEMLPENYGCSKHLSAIKCILHFIQWTHKTYNIEIDMQYVIAIYGVACKIGCYYTIEWICNNFEIKKDMEICIGCENACSENYLTIVKFLLQKYGYIFDLKTSIQWEVNFIIKSVSKYNMCDTFKYLISIASDNAINKAINLFKVGHHSADKIQYIFKNRKCDHVQYPYSELKIKEIYKVGGVGYVLFCDTISKGCVDVGCVYTLKSDPSKSIRIKNFESSTYQSHYDHPSSVPIIGEFLNSSIKDFVKEDELS